MLSSYCFSLVGKDHIKKHMPCHDSSLIAAISSSWKIAVVADGVGSCKHAETASKIAVETVEKLIKEQFPPFVSDDQTYFSVIRAAMHGAANAIERYVEKNDEGNEREYQTTLSVAVMSSKLLYYGNAGDSGIIALDDQGEYHLVTEQQNDDEGRVYAMPSNRIFEVGKAKFTPVATLCMTDGVYNNVVPFLLHDYKFQINVPFANLFITYALGLEKSKEQETTEKCKKEAIQYLQSDECKDMTDDLSVAVLVNTSSGLTKEEIKWEEPEIDFYALKWKEISIYPSEETRNSVFNKYIREKNPNWTEEQITELFEKYTGTPKQAEISKEEKKTKSNSSGEQGTQSHIQPTEGEKKRGQEKTHSNKTHKNKTESGLYDFLKKKL